jgi:hypothetical protein
MAFDFGGAFGGGLSGAATGSVFGPVGSVIGGLGGLITGGLSGGGPAPYEPTEQEVAFGKYGLNQIRPPKSTKKRIKAEFKQYIKSGNRGAAEAFLDQYKNLYADSKFIDKALTRSLKKPIDYSTPAYQGEIENLYAQQGLDLSDEDADRYTGLAKAAGIRSPQAFANKVKEDMLARRLVATPQQEMISYMFGPSARSAKGEILNLYTPYKMNYPSSTAAATA